ncbi:hypothetical protein E1B28_011507 [Marasmius oreades]|uniref:Histone acetyltransferase n=1 Tax=Marasmius oreades TaxID=181124 RepID=A0A9P7RVL3_9AGAR|nr:uncharacterized protein E1B28_011507 [Marasmius oreades]KAG7089863.1 hypothetical protein E1B28_011507 [Marasmius oreades]
MRGLAFPSNSISDRESFQDDGTPGSNIDIPLDPALGGPEPQAELQSTQEITDVQNLQIQPLPELPQNFPSTTIPYLNQYDQGPQGDPFAPPTAFFPPPALLDETHVQIPKPVKRKKKPKREEECGFCQGNDSKNKHGEAEQMLSCDVCGRSGHASCMELESPNLEMLRSYPWKCIECKNCEICMEKGDDNRILFCDCCDRGWHMDCLDPPLEEPPTGRWSCPQCPPVDEFEVEDQGPEEDDMVDDTNSTDEPIRGASVASTSCSHVPPPQPRKRPKTKRGRARRPRFRPDSELEEPELEVRTPARRGRPPKVATQSPKKRNGRLILEDSEDEDVLQSSSRQSKRIRISAPSIPRVRLRLGKGKEREDEESKGMFDDFLGEMERDTTSTTITNVDLQRFQRSRDIAEANLAPPAPPSHAHVSEPPDTPIAGPSSRPLRSATHHYTPANIPSASPAVSSPGPSTNPLATSPTLRIRSIRFGPYEIKTWYDAPFPEEYANIPDGRLWICEFCLKYMKGKFGAVRHRTKCKARHPPGDEIYRDGAISIFEVDGRKNKIYCQNLCLLSKMYLDHKSLFYDVEPFLFYVMTEVDDVGARFVGYFSKEKRSPKDYNVSCIMTLPVRQRKGWGNLLIDFSYLLSKKEKRTGSPEKPLSGLGTLGYKNYWTLSLMRYLETAPDGPLLEDISAATSMTIEDIYNTLVQQDMITHSPASPPPVRPSPGQSIKYPKGRRSGIARRHLQRTQTNDKPAEETPNGPFVPPAHYKIHWDRDRVSQYLATWEVKGYLTLKPEKLKWSPFFSNHTKKTEALQATDTDKLAMASKLAHQEQGIGSAPDIVADPAVTADGSAEGTPLSLFDDDDFVQAPGRQKMEEDATEVDREGTTESERHELPNGNGKHLSESNRLFTPTPEPAASEDQLFTPPPNSESPSVELNGANGIGASKSVQNEVGVLKDITSRKPLDNGSAARETPPVVVKRGRGRPRKTGQQRQWEQEQQQDMVELKTKGRPITRSKKQTEASPMKLSTTRRRRMAMSSSPEFDTTPVGRVNGLLSTGEQVHRATEDQMVDVKVEDLGTPSTVQESRHSFPSDVTVKGSDEPVKAANGDMDVVMTFDQEGNVADSDPDADGDYDMEIGEV